MSILGHFSSGDVNTSNVKYNLMLKICKILYSRNRNICNNVHNAAYAASTDPPNTESNIFLWA